MKDMVVSALADLIPILSAAFLFERPTKNTQSMSLILLLCLDTVVSLKIFPPGHHL